MAEINLLDKYPLSKRPIEERGSRRLSGEGWLNPKDDDVMDNTSLFLEQRLLSIARQFGKEYFDGDRLYGYGGYYYNPRFWTKTVKRFKDHYKLAKDAAVLDVGCAKGFLLYDFKMLMPHLKIAGLDISKYARGQAPSKIKPFIKTGNAKALPFPDKSFDLVIAINTVDHLPLAECIQAIKEIQRVSKKNAFVCVNAWRNQKEKEKLLKWNVTAKTVMHVNEWKKLFKAAGYKGDYWWFIAK